MGKKSGCPEAARRFFWPSSRRPSSAAPPAASCLSRPVGGAAVTREVQIPDPLDVLKEQDPEAWQAEMAAAAAEHISMDGLFAGLGDEPDFFKLSDDDPEKKTEKLFE